MARGGRETLTERGERAIGSGAVVGALDPTVGPTRGADVPPPVERPEHLVAWQLVSQARACHVMGSPLYAQLLTTAAQDVLGGGVLSDLLVPRVRPGRGDAAALRLMAAVHRLVLTRRAPRLAAHYPSVGGTPLLAVVDAAFLTSVAEHLGVLGVDIERPCQTNEVGRCAGLVVGLLEVAAVTGLPLALREVGAAAGLNLRMDAWRYELPDGHVVGDPDGEVVLTGRWRAPVPHAETPLSVVDRHGCDTTPIDATSAEGRLALSASVWADQTERFERLGGALRTAARIPAVVDEATASSWTREHATPARGRATVLYHSIFEEYLDADERADLHAAIGAAAERASGDAPFAWLAMEPSSELRHHTVSLRLWPDAPRSATSRGPAPTATTSSRCRPDAVGRWVATRRRWERRRRSMDVHLVHAGYRERRRQVRDVTPLIHHARMEITPRTHHDDGPAGEVADGTGEVAGGARLPGLEACPRLEGLLDTLAEMDRLAASAVAQIGQFHETGEVEASTGVPLELWLAIEGRRTRSDRRMLATASDVLERLPSLASAFGSGQVSWAQVRAVVCETRRLPGHLYDPVDAALARAIETTSDAEPDVLVTAVSRALASFDPEPGDRDEQTATRERYLAMQPRLDGTGGRVWGEFDALGFGVLDAVLDTGAPEPGTGPASDGIGSDPDDDRDARRQRMRSAGRARADRLVDLLARYLPGATLPAGDDHDGGADRDEARRADAHDAAHDEAVDGDDGDANDRGDDRDDRHAGDASNGREPRDDRAGDTGGAAGRGRPQVLVRLDYDTLAGGGLPADLLTTLTGGQLRLSATAARKLIDAGGADLRTVIVDGGEILGVGRRTRVPPGWLRDAILARDATCTAPNCRVAARVCALDHAVPWTPTRPGEARGPTDVANLAPVCRRDNHTKETDGWHAVGRPDGTRRWHHPRSGLTVTHHPDTGRPPPRAGPTPPARPNPPGGTDPPDRPDPPGRRDTPGGPAPPDGHEPTERSQLDDDLPF